jgi:RHS repeat-associated protein
MKIKAAARWYFWDRLCAMCDKGALWTLRHLKRSARRAPWPPQTSLKVERLEPLVLLSLAVEQVLNPPAIYASAGTGTVNLATVSYTGPLTDYAAVIDWGDGSATTTATLTPGASDVATLSGAHTYTSPGGYQIQLTLAGEGLTTAATAGILVLANQLSGQGVAIAATEESDFSGTVATFSDKDPNAAASDYTAVIDWGDGNVTAGGVQADPNGGFDVVGDYSYATTGNYNVTATVTRTDGSALVLDTAAAVAQVTPVVYASSDCWATAGVPFTGVLAGFSAGLHPDSAFTANIDWGDGSTSSGTIYGPSDPPPAVSSNYVAYYGYYGYNGYDYYDGSYNVFGNHTYSSPGPNGWYTITVTVTEDVTTATTGSGTGSIGVYENGYTPSPPPPDPHLTVSGDNITATEGQFFTGTVATFTDSDDDSGPGQYYAFVDWGDGSWGWSYGYDFISGSNGSYTVTDSHVYAQVGSYTVTTSVGDFDDGYGYYWCYWNIGTATATVNKALLDGVSVDNLTITPHGNPVGATAGVPLSNVAVANFTNPVASTGDFTARIDWGDGSAPASGTITGGAGTFNVQGSHTYASAGNYPITVTINQSATDQDGNQIAEQPVTSYTTATVAAPELTGAPLGTLTVKVGQALGDPVLATYTDPDTNDSPANMTATVSWGDGSTSSAVVSGGNGSFSVAADHAYSEPGDYAVMVLLQGDGARSVAIVDVDVTDPAPPPKPLFQAQGLRLLDETGSGFANAIVAVLTDPNPADVIPALQATINWGDGTVTPGILVQGSKLGEFDVLGTHGYAAGDYPLTVTISYSGLNLTATAYGTAIVLEQITAAAQAVTTSAPAQTGWSTMPGGLADAVVATFTDTNPNARPSVFTATINWGDGSSSAGTVLESNGTFYVLGNYSYYNTGTFTLQVTIDDGIGLAVATGTITVAAAAASTPGTFDTAIFEPANGSENLLSNAIQWGDGSPETIPEIAYWYYLYYWWYDGNSPTSIDGIHVYAKPGEYTTNTTATFVVPGFFTEESASSAQQTIDVAMGTTQVTGTLPAINDIAGVDPGDLTLAGFTSEDANADASMFTATILWGDGSASTGTVGAAGGAFTLQGDHIYADAGIYNVVILLSDSDGTVATSTTAYVRPNIVPGSETGQDFGALANIATGTIAVASFVDAGPASDFSSVVIDWGDGTTSPGTLVDSGGNFAITGNHTYASAGPFTFQITLDDVGGGTHFITGQATVMDWQLSATTLQRYGDDLWATSGDGSYSNLVSLGEAQVSLNTGGLLLSEPLDFDQSPGTDVGGKPALVYNSNAVDVQPIVEVTLSPAAGDPVLTTIAASLDGTNWMSFAGPASPSASGYLFAVQDSAALSASTFYQPTVALQLSAAFEPTVYAALPTLGAPAVVEDQSPLGAGWGIQGVDYLMTFAGGVLLVGGDGVGRFFSRNADGSFASPPGDFGTLTANPSNYSFTYTTPQQVRWNFTLDPATPGAENGSTFLLSGVVNPDGTSRTYTYDTNGLLQNVTSADGGVTSFAFPSGGGSAGITEPGGSISLTMNANNEVTQLTDAAGATRTFGYNQGQLISDQWGPYDTGFTYGAGGLLTKVGLIGTWQVSAAEGAGLGALASAALQGWGSLSDPLGEVTQYQFGTHLETDLAGQKLFVSPSWPAKEIAPGGGTQQWVTSDQGEIGSYADADGGGAGYSYDSSGDLLSVNDPTGIATTYQYDGTFHTMTLGTRDNVTISSSYDPITGELLARSDGAGNTTTYVWANGVMVSATDPYGNTTTYAYDDDNRQTAATDPLRYTLLTFYDKAGNVTKTVDAAGNASTSVYDGDDRLLTSTDPRGDTSATSHDAAGHVTETVDTLGHTTELSYDADGDVTASVDGDGNVTTTAYDKADRATLVTDPLGHTSKSLYDEDGNATATIDALGRTTHLFYDADGNATKTVDPEGNATTLSYDGDGRLTAVVDPLGDISQTSYDDAGHVTQTVDADGDATSTSYDGDGNVTLTVDGAGNTTHIYYNQDELLTETVDGAGNARTTNYDADGYATKTVDGLGNATTYADDADGNPTLTTDPDGDVTTTAYDKDGRATAVTDALGNTSNTYYDANGDVTETKDALGHTATTSYDAAGNVTETVDADGRATTTSYDADGQVTAVTDALGNTSTTAYDADGNATLSTDALGHTTTTAYDEDGRATKVTDADGNATTTAYDAAGDATAVTDPLGNITTTAYDPAGQATAVTDPLGHTSHTFYDGDGRVTETQDGDGNTTQGLYDADGRVTATVDGDGNATTTVFDRDGRATEVVDALGSATYTHYDKAGHVTATVDGLGNATTYADDADGDATLTTDPDGNVTTTAYDAAGRTTAVTDALGNTSTTYYDNDGTVTQTKDALGHTTLTSYDEDGDVTSSVDADGHATATAYDAAGRVTAVTDALGNTSTIAYDADGNATLSTDALGHTTKTAYDKDGHATKVTDADGNVTTTAYDAAGDATAVTDPLGNITTTAYDAAGQPTAVTDPLGHTSHTFYDADGHVTQTQDGDGNTTQSLYDADGRVTATVDGDGNATTTVFDKDGRATEVIDALGNATYTKYDHAGYLTERVDGLGNATTYVNDADGDATRATDPDGNVTTTAYDAAGRATAVTDALGNTSTTYYDNDGNVTETKDALGHTTLTSYDVDGDVTETVDADGHATETAYDAAGRVTAVTDALGNITTSYYDADGNVTETIDALGDATHTAYDKDGRATKMTDADGNATTTAYDAAGDATAVTDPLGNITTTAYGAAGQATAVTDPLGHTSHTRYDADGQVTANVDALGDTAQESYDADGQVTQTVDGAGNATTTLFDKEGRATEVIDALGNATYTKYDHAGYLTETVDGLGNATTYANDAAGNATLTTDPDGNATTTAYDAAGRATAVTDALGNTSNTYYDNDGTPTETKDALGHTTLTHYDADGDVTATVDGDGHATLTAYDAAGRATAVTDSLGNITTTAYDADGNVVQTADGDGNVTTTAYDKDGHVLKITDPDGNVTTYGYDAAGRQTALTDPLGNSTTYAYDAANRKTSMIDRDGRQTNYEYDADSRVIQETWYTQGSGTPVVDVLAYGYDADGNLTSASNDAGAYTLGYDPDGRVTSASEPFGVSLTFGYDNDGNRTLVSDSLGGITQSSYDADGDLLSRLLTQAGGPTLQVNQSFDAAGQVQQQERYSDAGTTLVGSTSFTHDPSGLVTSIDHNDSVGDSLVSYLLGYDAAGQLTSSTDHGATTTYSYDAAGQLTAAGASTYSYDAAGNPTTTGNVVGTGNELKSDGTSNFSYDAEGNQIEKVNIATGDTWVYGYNNANEMTSADEYTSDPKNGGILETTVAYSFDVFGNRVEQDYFFVPLATTFQQRYAYDGWNPGTTSGTGNENWNIWADLAVNSDGSVSLATRYLRGDALDELWARMDFDSSGTATPLWYLTDRQGSVRDITDNTGAVVDSLQYDAFGNIVTETNPGERGRYAWDSREFDTATNLYNMGERVDNPETRQWQSEDPTSFRAGDSNLRRYVGNDPVNGTDPSGLERIEVDGQGRVWWVTQNQGTFRNSDSGVWIDIGGLDDSALTAPADRVVTLNSGQRVRLNDVQTLAQHFWNDFADVSSQTSGTQVSVVQSALGRLPQNGGPARNFITTRSASGQLLDAGLEGAQGGAIIVANTLTFDQVPLLNEESQRLLAADPSAYRWSRVAAVVAREALVTAATSGLMQGAQALSQAQRVQALAQRLPTLMNVVSVGARGATPVLTGLQATQIAGGILGAAEAWDKGDYASGVESLAEVSFGAVGFSQSVQSSYQVTADFGKLLRDSRYTGAIATAIHSRVRGLASGGTAFSGVPIPPGQGSGAASAQAGLFPTRPGATGAGYNEATGHGIYVLRNPRTHQIEYVGRGDAPARLAEHARLGSGKDDLVGEILFNNNIPANQARSLEQELMQNLGGPRSTNPTTPLRNSIQGIAESNPEFLELEFAADDALVIEAFRRAGVLPR